MQNKAHEVSGYQVRTILSVICAHKNDIQMAGMIFMVTVPTECEENKFKTKSHDVPNVVITNEHQMPRSDPKCAAVESGSVGSVRQIYFVEKK